jgi:hypothetical protein
MDSEPRSCIIEAMPPRDAAETLVQIARGASATPGHDVEQLQAAALADMSAPAASSILQHMAFRVRRGGPPGLLGQLALPCLASSSPATHVAPLG